MNYISEIVYTALEGEHFGPFKSSTSPPINQLDSEAQIHDAAYSIANIFGGSRGRVLKARADFSMAADTNNFIVKSAMFTQGMIRVFTFNRLNLPW